MEEQSNYITQEEIDEAREMIGMDQSLSIEIESPRVVTEVRGGKLIEADRPAFVKIYTSFKAEMKNIDADALKVWLFIALSVNRHSGEAHPGLRAISDGVGMAINTVRSAVERLETEYHLLEVEKEDGKSNKYYPADYVSATKETVSPRDTPQRTVSNSEPTVSKNGVTVSKNDGTVSTQYRKSAQPEEPEEPDLTKKGKLSEKELEQANAKVTAMIANAKKVKYENRDKIPEQYLSLCDVYVELTKQTPTKRVLIDWLSTFSDWISEGLQPKDIRAAHQHANRPDGGFLVGRPGSLTNTAVALKSKTVATAPQIDDSAVEATKRMIEQKVGGEFVPRPASVPDPVLVKQRLQQLSQQKGIRK